MKYEVRARTFVLLEIEGANESDAEARALDELKVRHDGYDWEIVEIDNGLDYD